MVNHTHFLIYRYARCNCKLWRPFDFITFFLVFSYIIDEYSWLKHCIFTKLSQIMCLINVKILVYQMWLQVMEGFLLNFRFLRIFHTSCLKRYNFIKIFKKVTLCKHLWLRQTSLFGNEFYLLFYRTNFLFCKRCLIGSDSTLICRYLVCHLGIF